MTTVRLPRLHAFSDADQQRLKQLSDHFAPPRIDFFEATRLDDNGATPDNRFGDKRHKTVEDVKESHFKDFREFSYMTPEDLVFYLQPIYNTYTQNNDMDAVGFFVFSLERAIDRINDLLSTEEKCVLRHTLHAMIESTWMARISGDATSPDNGLCVEVISDINLEDLPRLAEFMQMNQKPFLVFP